MSCLEIGIGIYVLLSPFLFDLSSRLFTSLAESVGDRGILTVARIVVTLTALLLPAFLMGATFPAMIAGSALDSPSTRTARAGYLYSVNTLGAAVGCFVAGFEFLFGFGVQATLVYAFGLYLLAALCAFIANTIAQSKIVKAVREPSPSLEKDSGKKVKTSKAKDVAAGPIALRDNPIVKSAIKTFSLLRNLQHRIRCAGIRSSPDKAGYSVLWQYVIDFSPCADRLSFGNGNQCRAGDLVLRDSSP